MAIPCLLLKISLVEDSEVTCKVTADKVEVTGV